MHDDLLRDLDRSFARVTNETPGAAVRRGVVKPPTAPAPIKRVARAFRERYPLVDIFIAVQFLWGALLFIPGVQSYRALIRALPYVSSVALVVPYFTQRTPGVRHPGSASFLVAALA